MIRTWSTWLAIVLLAPVRCRPGLAWRLEVGCDINGFFVELLGVLGALDALVPGGVVLRGLRCSERELAKLFPEEAAALTRATSRADDDASVPEIVHGRCGEGITHEKLPVYVYGQARPRAARLMVERARGSGDAEVYSCAARARRVIVPTQWNADQFGHNAVVAAEAVDANLFSPAAAEADASARQAIDALIGHKTTFRVLSIFKWERRKAPDVLIDGFFQAFPDNTELVLHAYRPSWERGDKNLQRVAEAMRPPGATARLTWLGGVQLSRRELRALYASADCFALPTRGEGWGLPVHEALAMQLPVVVTGIAGPLEITGGVNGTAWLIDAGGRGIDGLARPRAEDLAAALREIREDPVGALKRAAAGRERVARLFSPAAVARHFVEALGVGFFRDGAADDGGEL